MGRFSCHKNHLAGHVADNTGAAGGLRRRRKPGHGPHDARTAAPRGLSRRSGDDPAELDIERRWMLLARIDREELGRFFDKYHGPVFSYIRHRVLDEDTAEDLLSETFLEAVDRIGSFRFQGVTFGAFLFRIAQRRLARYFRTINRQPRMAPLDEEHATVMPDGPAVVQAGEDARMLALCIRQLANEDQDIVILHYYERLKPAQVAVVMGMREGLIRQRLTRARRELARLLDDPEIKRRLSQEGRRALQALHQGERQMRLLDGRDRGSHE